MAEPGITQLDQAEIQRSFGRAAANYETNAWLQKEVRSRLHERLDELSESRSLQPQRVLDIGCGPGFGTAALKQRFTKAQVIGLDLALPMCQQLLQHNRGRWLSKQQLQVVQADAVRLPFAAASMDIITSNLTVQWLQDWPGFLNSLRRILKPGGLLLFSTFGPDTLLELRQAWLAVDQQPRVSEFIDQHIIGDQLLASGFINPVMDVDRITVTYNEVRQLVQDLKRIGAHNAGSQRQRSLTSKGQWMKMQSAYEGFRNAEQLLPATWEVVYATAWGPDSGQPIRTTQGEQARFSVEQLRNSLKPKP